MARIATYVFLDLETTSIPQIELNKTKITELSMFVLKREHILDTRHGELPRVQSKLTMCFNPCRLIEPGATDTSGLDNFLLEHETKFNMNAFNTINSFLECQRKPVCLIAQNGHMFDFPILKNHFEKLNVHLGEDILCADSLHAFYDILNMEKWNRNETDDNIHPNEIVKVPLDNVIISTDRPDNISNLTIENSSKGIDKSAGDQIVDSTVNSQLSFKLKNEQTPKVMKIKASKNIKEARRKLFYEKETCKPKESYKLKDIYERILGQPAVGAHRAENDCIMTAEISVAKAEQFIKWIDENHCAFSEVMPMRLGVPVGY